ncbi:hypothetical protein Rs2_16552 [Raphanus sativus]|nr:hypothetical protein Rs2_16552 [Raphanus sativus]
MLPASTLRGVDLNRGFSSRALLASPSTSPSRSFTDQASLSRTDKLQSSSSAHLRRCAPPRRFSATRIVDSSTAVPSRHLRHRNRTSPEQASQSCFRSGERARVLHQWRSLCLLQNRSLSF